MYKFGMVHVCKQMIACAKGFFIHHPNLSTFHLLAVAPVSGNGQFVDVLSMSNVTV
jgi:hypothetical protein